MSDTGQQAMLLKDLNCADRTGLGERVNGSIVTGGDAKAIRRSLQSQPHLQLQDVVSDVPIRGPCVGKSQSRGVSEPHLDPLSRPTSPGRRTCPTCTFAKPFLPRIHRPYRGDMVDQGLHRQHQCGHERVTCPRNKIAVSPTGTGYDPVGRNVSGAGVSNIATGTRNGGRSPFNTSYHIRS